MLAPINVISATNEVKLWLDTKSRRVAYDSAFRRKTRRYPTKLEPNASYKCFSICHLLAVSVFSLLTESMVLRTLGCIKPKIAFPYIALISERIRKLYNHWRMPSSWIWRRVSLLRTDISGKLIASIIMVTRIGKLGTTLATNKRSTLRRNTIVYTCSSETSVLKNLTA
jgi:hypothetical protein